MRKFLVYKSVEMIANELQREKAKRAPVPAERARGEIKSITTQSGTVARDILFESTQSRREPVMPAMNSETHREGAEPSDRTNRWPLPGEGHLSSHSDTPTQHGFVLANVDHARKKAETEVILGALNSALWNRKEAAKLLKIDYKALLYKMKKLRIGEKSSDDPA
jgi:DNA-binding NtrC family response regulator